MSTAISISVLIRNANLGAVALAVLIIVVEPVLVARRRVLPLRIASDASTISVFSYTGTLNRA